MAGLNGEGTRRSVNLVAIWNRQRTAFGRRIKEGF